MKTRGRPKKTLKISVNDADPAGTGKFSIPARVSQPKSDQTTKTEQTEQKKEKA